MAATLKNINTREKTALITAVENNDLKLVQSAIAEGVDVNERTSEGDTALHLAISQNADFEILKLLLTNGASATVKNYDGYNPLQLIEPDSFETFLNLFRLENYIDYSGGFGNTIMHLMMMTTIIDDRQKWTDILTEFPHLHINFNAQNMIGHTPLHIAASKLSGDVDLEFILSNFSNLDLLVADKKGDTFLHTFLVNELYGDNDISFLTSLLKGKYQDCPDAVLKELLQSRNLTGHTPLHLCINENNIMNVELLQMFLKAGSKIGSENVFGDSLLHALVRKFPEEADLIECAISNDVNLNAKNGFGDSLIFLTDDINVLQILLEFGADLNIKNKVGKTPLMSQLLKSLPDPDIIQMFLAKGADVNAKDKHESTVLHYAAWNNVEVEIVHMLKQSGANTVSDKLGQLPCHVAQKRGHTSLIDHICTCDTSVKQHSDSFSFQEALIHFQDIFQQNCEISQSTFVQERAKRLQCSSMSEVLRYPYLGSVMFQEEAEEVKYAVARIIQNICQELGKQDKMLSNSIIQSGSVGENTKVGLPDEFDFVCILDLFTSLCEVDEAKSADDPGYVYLKLKPEFRGVDQYRHLFDQECFLDPEVLRRQYLNTLMYIIQNPDLCCHENIIMDFGQFTESKMKPNCQLFLRWTSCEYKDILINVDLVPACRIKGWWPQNTNLDSLVGNVDKVREEGALLLLQTMFDEDYDEVSKLRISALTAEKMHMASLPQVARDVYMMSKTICGERICSRISMSKDSQVSFLKTNITSYMLKNCLFHVFGENTNADNAHDIDISSRVYSPESLHGYVCKLFKKFLKYIKKEKLPCYVFPWQDIFTFQESVCDLFPDQNHMKCTCREVYIKLILTILGEEQNFTDIDVNVLDSS